MHLKQTTTTTKSLFIFPQQTVIQVFLFSFSSYLNKTLFLFHRLLGAKCVPEKDFRGPFKAPLLWSQAGAVVCAGHCREHPAQPQGLVVARVMRAESLGAVVHRGDLDKMCVILNYFLRSH